VACGQRVSLGCTSLLLLLHIIVTLPCDNIVSFESALLSSQVTHRLSAGQLCDCLCVLNVSWAPEPPKMGTSPPLNGHLTPLNGHQNPLN